MVLAIFILSLLGGTPAKVRMSTDHRLSYTAARNQAREAESKREVPAKDNALRVLHEKCNVCHRRQNPRKVFTEANMDGLASAVYKQVFVKKRMPRGNTIKLTEADEKALLDWIGGLGIRD